MLAAGCHAPLPASVAALGENVEEFSASAQGKIGTSYVLGELAVEMRVVPPPTWGRNEEYDIVAYGKRVGTFHCTARRAGVQYAFGEHEQLQYGDGRSWSLQLVYANWRFPRGNESPGHEPLAPVRPLVPTRSRQNYRKR